MTAIKIEKVGLVAHYSDQGNWAFHSAFEFARSNNLQLNVFYFLNSFFTMPSDKTPKELETPVFSKEQLIAEERKLREYYDELLGDYVKVGFKICESVRHNFELRSCLMQQDFQILFIPYLYRGVPFGNMPIEEFAFRFNAPVILIGPESERECHINPPAHIASDMDPVTHYQWSLIEKPEHFQELSVL
jgi:hypothetical protein